VAPATCFIHGKLDTNLQFCTQFHGVIVTQSVRLG